MSNSVVSEANQNDEKCSLDLCPSRRQFLFASGTAMGAIILSGIPGLSSAAKLEAELTRYPRVKIGKVSALKVGKAVKFKYPAKDFENLLIKVGVPAGGGVGPDKDIVAFNALCSHMGGDLSDVYKAEDKVLGQCPFHQTTFDVTKHGMIVSGHATQSLPQIELEVEKDDIYATGVIGLIYGCHANPMKV